MLPRFDARDPDVQDDPYPAYARLRAAGPLCRIGPGAYGVSRHADVAALLGDPRLGSEFPVEYHRASAGDGAAADFLGQIMLYRDPPEHHRLRKLFGKAFTPAIVRGLRADIERMVRDLMAPALADGGCDVVQTLAYPLPVMVISRLMGIPVAAHDEVRTHAIRLGRAFNTVVAPDRRSEADESVRWLRAFVGELLERRAVEPGDDLLSRLLRARSDGDSLTREEIVDNTVFAFFAGFETTVHLITNGFALLLRHPDQWQRLRADAGLVPTAVEEFLRCEAPIQGIARLVRQPLEIGGQQLRAGRVLVLMVGSANHDERVFDRPEQFDVGRQPNPHLAFGGGGHLCLGAFLARAEGQVVFDWLIRHTAVLAAAGPAQRESDTPFRAYHGLPVALRQPAG